MNKGKNLLTGLLLIACVLSTILLGTLPTPPAKQAADLQDLEEIIQRSFEDFGILNQRKSTIEIDSTFSRLVYRARVSPEFSKTSFHLDLQHQLHEYSMEVPSKVIFPEEDMNIHVVANNTIFVTIRLITDKSIIAGELDG